MKSGNKRHCLEQGSHLQLFPCFTTTSMNLLKTNVLSGTHSQIPVMKYSRQLMQAIRRDRINIAEVVGVQMISLDPVPEGYGEFDAGVPKKFAIDPHTLFCARNEKRATHGSPFLCEV